MIKLFATNKLVIKLDKINIMKFITKKSSHLYYVLVVKGKYIAETVNSKFLGLRTDNHINWKNHIEKMIPNLCGACYAITSMVQISNINTLKSIYYAYFHSIMKYGIIFWDTSSNS